MVVGVGGAGGGLGFGLAIALIGDGLQDDVAPFVFVGGEIFLFGEGVGFEEEMAETGEGVDRFGFEIALGAGAEKHGESIVEIGGGVKISAEEAADLDAGIDGETALHFAFFVKETKPQVAVDVRHIAMAAVVEGEGAQTGAIVGGRHSSAPES